MKKTCRCGAIFEAKTSDVDCSPTCMIKRRSVETDGGCWQWAGATDSDGYGVASWKARKNRRAHALSYEAFGGVAQDGCVICHSCDNPSCVNPQHLRSDTQSSNIKEAFAKGRKKPPSFAKLSESQVRQIRSATQGIRGLAKTLGVSYSTLKNIRNGTAWGHIQGQPEK